MEFFTVSNDPRPIRLPDSTRQFAWDSLNHKYGLDTRAFPGAVLDQIPNFQRLSPLQQYDAAIQEIVTQCPIRICPGEKLSGAATFGIALNHQVPATYKGNALFSGISHLTVDFETVLSRGIDGIEADLNDRLQLPATEQQKAFLNSAGHCLRQFRRWHSRYLDALKELPGYEANYQNLLQVPFRPARNFYEAVQSIWFSFAFLRLCGNWPGIGRIDWLLGSYLKQDLEKGTITLDEARDILAHLFIKGCEWICGGDYGSGDAQHYQNLVLAGVDENGEEVTNEVTCLVLDILEELSISDFPTTLRLNSRSPEMLLRRTAQVMKHGGGVLAIYNEDKILESMTAHGYSLREARKFANDGCWEVQVPGKTYFTYVPFDALNILLNDTLKIRDGGAQFDSFAALRAAFLEKLETLLVDIRSGTASGLAKKVPNDDWCWLPQTPCTVVSLFEQGCIQNAASYVEGGPVYRVISPHIGGAADVGNSLRVIDKLCFREKLLPLQDFLEILKNNWEGQEPLRQFVRNKISGYGNDDDEADAYTVDIVNNFARLTHKNNCDAPFMLFPGVSTFGRQIEWRWNRPAAPHGHKTGDILAPNMGATPGSDLKGATALIRSYCKLDLKEQVTGAALDLKLLPGTVRGEEGTQALIGLMRGFVTLGGCFLQPDVVDSSILKDAREHPENYQSLSVRVSGWNARFVTLNKEWQDMCIQKTEHGEL